VRATTRARTQAQVGRRSSTGRADAGGRKWHEPRLGQRRRALPPRGGMHQHQAPRRRNCCGLPRSQSWPRPRGGSRSRRPRADHTMLCIAAWRSAQQQESARLKVQLLETRDARRSKGARTTPTKTPRVRPEDTRRSSASAPSESGLRDFHGPCRKSRGTASRRLTLIPAPGARLPKHLLLSVLLI